jgi:hypothetical protein
MPSELPRDCRELLTIQAGVIARRQAVAMGVPPSAIDARLRYGRWQSMQHGVYATFSGPQSREAQLWAAVLRGGPGAALSHHSAAELFGLVSKPGEMIHLTVPWRLHPERINGAIVHRSRAIEVATHPALLPPRTRVEDTVLDLAQASANLDDAFGWLCRAVSHRLTTPDHILTTLDQRTRVRWRPDLIVALTDVAAGVMSLLERRYVNDVERAHGLPTARRQVRLKVGARSRYLDNLYEEAQLAVETDGDIAHPPEQRWADAHRDNENLCAGILTVRYGWADITTRPCDVAAQVATLLLARGMTFEPRRCGSGCAAQAPLTARRQRWPAHGP